MSAQPLLKGINPIRIPATVIISHKITGILPYSTPSVLQISYRIAKMTGDDYTVLKTLPPFVLIDLMRYISHRLMLLEGKYLLMFDPMVSIDYHSRESQRRI